MSTKNIIRAWKDEAYRNSLSQEELAQLPANPVGLIELDDAELEIVAGGASCETGTWWECRGCTSEEIVY